MKNLLPLVPLVTSLFFACDDDSCFVRGTRVLTPGGWRAIEELEVGDEVVSFDTASKVVLVRRVARLLRSQVSRVARVRAGELAIAGVSLSHPVWDEAARRWTPVAELSLSASVVGLLPGATPHALALSEVTLLSSSSPVEVFNLEVDGEEHNYFAEGILVHNKSGGSGSGNGTPNGGQGGEIENCFVSGTRVLTPSGWCAIEKLAPGDQVTSYDTVSKSVVTRKVAELIAGQAPSVARLQAGELTIAGASLTHPFWDEAAQSWKPLSQLSLTTTLVGLLPGGTPSTLALTGLEHLPSKAPIEVWNLRVDGEEHNYFAEGILVHNKSGGAPEGGFGGDGGAGGTGGDVLGGAGGTVNIGGAGGSGGAK